MTSLVVALSLAKALVLAAPEPSQGTTPPATPPAQDQDVIPSSPFAPPPTKGLVLQSGDFTWKFGGYIKVDLIHDFDDIGSTDFFDPRTIPTSGAVEPGDTTHLQANQTRFNLDVRGPSTAGPFRGFFEGDFYGTDGSFRIRHAFGEIEHVLGGKTWTTFMDEEAMPETLDFESPTAFPLVRTAQIRWSQKLEGGDYFAMALEDPASEVEPPPGVTGEVKEPWPDLTGRYHWLNPLGHVQLGLFTGMARFVPDTGGEDDALLWGVNVSTKLKTWEKDYAIAQVTYGDGVGRYRGGITAAPDANGDLEAVPILGLMGSYEHHWSEKYRSTLAYSWGEADLPGDAQTSDSQEVQYLAANLIWQFADRAWVGMEYLYGYNETFDDEDGTANRLQFSMRFDL